MLKVILIFLSWMLLLNVRGQEAGGSVKPAIDTSVFGKWPSVGGGHLSGDGRYVSYRLENVPGGSHTVVLESSEGNWRVTLEGGEGCVFSSDSHWAAVQEGHDSVCLILLGTDKQEHPGPVKSWVLSGYTERTYLAYMREAAGKDRSLVLRDLTGGGDRSWTGAGAFTFDPSGRWFIWEDVSGIDSGAEERVHVLDLKGRKERIVERGMLGGGERVMWYYFDPSDQVMVWENRTGADSDVAYTLHCAELKGGHGQEIWRGRRQPGDPSFDGAGRQLAFTAPDGVGGGEDGNGLWYYRAGMSAAECKVRQNGEWTGRGLFISAGVPVFSRDGERIFFKLAEKKSAAKAAPGSVPMTVWSYRDDTLQSEQLRYVKRPVRYMASLEIKDRRVLQVEHAGLQADLFTRWEEVNRYVVLMKGGGSDSWWKESRRPSVCLVDLQEGTERLLRERMEYGYGSSERFEYEVSPGERYLVYYDPVAGDYFSYEISTGERRNLTRGLGVVWKDSTCDDLSPYLGYPVGMAGLLRGDSGVLVYDNYDIWRLDLSGRRAAENITGGYGKAHGIRLRYIWNGEGIVRDMQEGESMLLSGFDTKTKRSGFYRKEPGRAGNPDSLTMDDCWYEVGGGLQQAGGARVWLVRRERAEESPDYYVTGDFKGFRAVSGLHPEGQYNWLRSELVNWRLPDGSMSQGILYKPEDFDEKKKYPLLLNYYEQRSDGLHKYHIPGASTDNINIPYFVSRGYIVFVPDIHYRIGYTGESALACIQSAAMYLSREPWIDSSRMGLQGHSFGGYETNYVVTHSHLFAAAAESCGLTDLISEYGAIQGLGISEEYGYEVSQIRLRATLWEHPDWYIMNSPVMRADSVTTPLLMLHNREDGSVPYAQGVELYTALRRLGRRAWMLEYDHEGHEVSGRNAVDYTLRMEQFFGYYLKGELPPRWMTEGIRASRKGIDTGYEPDHSGRIP